MRGKCSLSSSSAPQINKGLKQSKLCLNQYALKELNGNRIWVECLATVTVVFFKTGVVLLVVLETIGLTYV